MQRSFVSGWTRWIFVFVAVAGSVSLVTVQQPPLLAAALGGAAELPCSVRLSGGERVTDPPVFYWTYGSGNLSLKVWRPSGAFEGRVAPLEPSPDGLNRSIRLGPVRWADGGRYLCKLSVTVRDGDSFRCSGDSTALVVHGELLFGRAAAAAASLLRCRVNVTRGAPFRLDVLRDGGPATGGAPFRLDVLRDGGPPRPGPATGGAVGAPPFVTLSETVHLQESSRYECRLHLEGRLVTSSSFSTETTGVKDPQEPPEPREPWHLYTALLLVPVAFLLPITWVTWRSH